MTMESYNLKIVLILTVGFALASVLGYFTQRIKLSPLLGYLLAGYVIGPYSPGFVADSQLAEQLAEIGVILMMFGVGMHFKWQDLINVKGIAIPGAIIQTTVSAVIGAALVYFLGWSIESGIIIGLSIGVASTVVLVRVLTDNNILHTPQGHIAVGWLIVEDILTVLVLLMLPVLAVVKSGAEIPMQDLTFKVMTILFKFIFLVGLMFTLGRRFVKYVLFHVARTRSHELFTLTMLALIFVIATGSALIFGTSIALGAFIAGMVIGQTDVKHQASANALPLKDVFVVLFFLSVGMIFNPQAIHDNFQLFIGILAIILLVKPLTAFLIVKVLGYSTHTGITVSIALAQIGEFSFILAEEAMRLKLLPDDGYDLIVACAIVSISLNPLLFSGAERLWRRLEKKMQSVSVGPRNEPIFKKIRKAIIVGFGPVGKSTANLLEKIGYSVTIIERNIDTVAKLKEEKKRAVYGDATSSDILESAQIDDANLLVLTVPDKTIAVSIINIARQMHPKIEILTRVVYVSDEQFFRSLNVHLISSEEETIKAFHDAIFRMRVKF